MAELIFPTGFEEKATIAQDDVILMADSEDNYKIKKAKYSFLKGEKGDTGDKGDKGDTGDTGPQGEQGIQGEKGDPGQNGQDGADGQDGQDGTDGASIVSGEFVGDDLVFTKDDGNTVTIENAATTLQGPQGEEGEEGPQGPAGQDGADGTDGEDGNGIASITSSKSGKVTTVTITETNGDSESFQISDGQDGQGSGDVIGPNSSTNEDIVLMDGTDGKHIKDGSKKLSDLVQTSGNQTVNGVKTFGSEPVLPSKTTTATNDGTKPATEAQVYNVANGLGTAASKNTGTSSGNVPVIGSNGKLDNSIVPDVHSDAVTSVNGQTGAVTGLQTTANLKTDLTDNSDSYYPSQKAVKIAVDAKQNTIDSSHKLSADLVSNGTNNRVCVVGATAPSTPSEGDLWYDTTNDVLKSYNGTSWDEAGGSGGIQNLPGSPITINYKWSGSKAAFEALSTYRADTEYNVIG